MMGMFDDIEVRMKLPHNGEPCPHTSFQTKSFDDPYLDKYILSEDGTMTKNAEPFSYHGMVNFYMFELSRSGGQEWWEYDAKFTDGICVEIVAVKDDEASS